MTQLTAHGADADLYRLLVDTVRDYAIFALDPTGHVASWNEGARRIKGYERDEIIGKHFSVFYPPEKIAERFPEYELEVAAREGRFEDEDWRVRKDGTKFWANVVITALHDDTGKLVGFAKVTRDLTERREAQLKAVEDARRLALSEEANRTKSAFLAAMSHELRTPLNAIGGYADLLLAGVGGELGPQQRQYVERLHAGQRHLLAVINDILNFSRIEAGQLEYDIEPVRLQDSIDAVLPLIEPQARARQLELTNGDPADVTVLADGPKVEQILINLLSNAVKFTEPGGRISLRAGRNGDHGYVSVRDTGVGIPAEKLGAVFQPFVQVGRNLTSPHEGTGLGLAISSDLAHGMGGDLGVESTVGEGSEFTLKLPLAIE
ncbi:MAG TPA: ATP-binding protein [Gemmatimonadaceae bacterium]|nr:ATP-binding protein [Gemmatimonadaceae bacterium]